MPKIFTLTILIFIMVSCGEAKTEPEKGENEIYWEKQKKLDTLNQDATINLSKKFNGLANDDSTIDYTYQIQDIVKKENRLISFTAYIKDITQKDSNYVLKIYGVFVKRRCFAEIVISNQQFNVLVNQLDKNSFPEKGCFIFKPSSIKSSSLLKIDSEVTTDDYAETVEEANENASSELTYDFHSVFLLFKGTLVDFYMFKKM